MQLFDISCIQAIADFCITTYIDYIASYMNAPLIILYIHLSDKYLQGLINSHSHFSRCPEVVLKSMQSGKVSSIMKAPI